MIANIIFVELVIIVVCGLINVILWMMGFRK